MGLENIVQFPALESVDVSSFGVVDLVLNYQGTVLTRSSLYQDLGGCKFLHGNRLVTHCLAFFLSGSALYLKLQRKVCFLFKDCVYKSLIQHHNGGEVLFSHARSGTDHSVILRFLCAASIMT